MHAFRALQAQEILLEVGVAGSKQVLERDRMRGVAIAGRMWSSEEMQSRSSALSLRPPRPGFALLSWSPSPCALVRGHVADGDRFRLPMIALRILRDDDLDDLFRWQSEPSGVHMAAFTRADPTDRAEFDAHYQQVRSDPDITMRAIEEGGSFVGMIASFTLEGDRELTYWIDPQRWGHGIASQALRTFLDSETQRPLFARAAEHNLGSRTVLLRNGFVEVSEETSWAAGVGRQVLEHTYRLD